MLVILLLVFGSVVAAAMPLVVGALAVIGSFVILRLLDMVVPVSVFSVNITTALGLGLAIDYSLFIVTRYREELGKGRGITEAIGETLRTAGRTVIFSALTVALSLSAMLVIPMYHLRSFAYSGIAVVALAALGSIVVLPALLAMLGRRIDALDVRRLLRRRPRAASRDTTDQAGFWHRLASAVMRRPLPFTLTVAALLTRWASRSCGWSSATATTASSSPGASSESKLVGLPQRGNAHSSSGSFHRLDVDTARRPPGRSTRDISASAAAGCPVRRSARRRWRECRRCGR